MTDHKEFYPIVSLTEKHDAFKMVLYNRVAYDEKANRKWKLKFGKLLQTIVPTIS